ncbi:hypothetical protein E1193_10975 [Micromonospora sp. KC606]|uniref:alpha/beta fold hydrolase n=1 Tax=Micromonospora sp. KC606 TaxID=2530379 RepID=UPI0010455AFB|nr:hypothetical protein [Micromonospora sp. KC606]TDC82703.1 hypothetical protein E1193_10975 [Micromonospora sp. KC606]
MEIRYAELPGLRMAYRSWGRPDAPPVVGPARRYRHRAGLAAATADQVHLCAPDLRGFSGSDRFHAVVREFLVGLG